MPQFHFEGFPILMNSTLTRYSLEMGFKKLDDEKLYNQKIIRQSPHTPYKTQIDKFCFW